MNYAYYLDRSSRKYICPACGRHTFVLYLDKDGQSLDPSVGKCDRLDNCSFHKPPRQYFAERRKETPSCSRHYDSQRQRPRPISTIDHEMVYRSMAHREQNQLIQWLYRLFGGVMSREDIDIVLDDYWVGTSKMWGGSTVWWQIDPEGRVRTGKVMAYSSKNGKRVKDPHPLMQWAHKLCGDQREEYNLKQCYWGIHLTVDYPESGLWLVESEKAALILALALKSGGEYCTWIPVATGGCEGFQTSLSARVDPRNTLHYLRDKRVTIYPDEGQWDKWYQRASKIWGMCSKLLFSNMFKPDAYGNPVRGNQGDGPDDLIIRQLEKAPDDADALAHLIVTQIFA